MVRPNCLLISRACQIIFGAECHGKQNKRNYGRFLERIFMRMNLPPNKIQSKLRLFGGILAVIKKKIG
jgi:hypothetical protein